MDTPTIVSRVKACSPGQLKDIEKATGVPATTLAKIKYGETTDPRGSTVDALRAYFARRKAA